ncbi:MAG: SDR family NAD(P)-dependent oxidoreductase [Fluviicoccus sp.]|uniref:SDR family NAD(P)-dependent oxidoreductase n=1 Tax=Fluviicoccus sp. TaxID=2003552 RepID=UPI002726DD51|nr:SDR family NAD(P)-dependent oxidoreductase [Fluviicoccus sp.]MDO8330613.1 SDR family NAD(P)-dependent oxidoreductase [Fluviicoccus sp.]
MYALSGKVVAITGAGNGIGRALALACATRGAQLALSDIKEEPLQETARLVEKLGGRAVIRLVDVAKRDEVEAWAAAAAAELGGVDVIINNAGVALLDTLEDVPYEEFRWVFDILFWGVVHGTRAFLPQVRARKGVVVNLGSIHSFIAAPNNGPYCAAKSAVRGFCDALREEVRDAGVQVLLVMPGGIKTEIVRNSKVRKFINAGASQEDVHRAHNAASLTSPEQAARIILDAVEARNPRQLVGIDAVFYDGLTRLMPSLAHRLYAWGAKRMAVQRPARA